MPASTGGNDFFLQFGSNAPEFSRELSEGLIPGILAIDQMREALAEYERTVARVKGGNTPLANQFQGLDVATKRFEDATINFGKGFAAAMNTLQGKLESFAAALNNAGRHAEGAGAGVGNGQRLNQISPEAQARLDAIEAEKRRVATAGQGVTTGDANASKAATDKTVRSADDVAAANKRIATAGNQVATTLEELAVRLARLQVSDGAHLNGNGVNGRRDEPGGEAPPITKPPQQVAVVEDKATPKATGSIAQQVVAMEQNRLGLVPANKAQPAASPTQVDPAQAEAAAAARRARQRSEDTYNNLSDASRRRLERAGIDQAAYLAGANTRVAYGHRGAATAGSQTEPSEDQAPRSADGRRPGRTQDEILGITRKVPNKLRGSSYADIPGYEGLAQTYLTRLDDIDALHGPEGTNPHPILHRERLNEARTEFNAAKYDLLPGIPDPARIASQRSALAGIRDRIGREEGIDIPAYLARDAAHADELRAIQQSTGPGALRNARVGQTGARSNLAALQADEGTTASEIAAAELRLSEADDKVAIAEAKVREEASLLAAERQRAIAVDQAFAASSERVTEALIKEADAEYRLAEIRAKGGTGTSQERLALANVHETGRGVGRAAELSDLESDLHQRSLGILQGNDPRDVQSARLAVEQAVYKRHAAVANDAPVTQQLSAEMAHGAAQENLRQATGNASINAAQQAKVNQILATTSGEVREALLRQAIAQAELDKLQLQGAASTTALTRAQIQLDSASGNVDKALAAQGGEGGFLSKMGLGLGKSGGYALRHMIAFSLVFSGAEKLKEIVKTGLEAQVAMVRLNAEMKATGKSSDGVAESLQNISSTTATPLNEVIRAASELSGVFKDTKGVIEGTKVAAGLALLSQGQLSPDQSATSLRNSVSAFDNVRKDPMAYADNIAYLQQRTGVNVADIVEGSTTLAQEANDFGLNSDQTAAISAYVTQNTGEKGEAAAEQTSRLLSTFYNGKVQNTLVNNGITDQSKFLNGDIAGVLSDLVRKWDTLPDAVKQTVAGQVGGGRQARVFAAFTSGGEGFANMLDGETKWKQSGAFQKQQDAYLNTVQGQVHQLAQDFHNIGDSLRRVGAFDAIGMLAKSFGILATTMQKVFNVVDEFEHALGPLGVVIGHGTVAILEMLAAGALLRRMFPSGMFGGRVAGGISSTANFLSRGRFGTTAAERAATRAGTSGVGPGAFNRSLGLAVPTVNSFTAAMERATLAANGEAVSSEEVTAANEVQAVTSRGGASVSVLGRLFSRGGGAAAAGGEAAAGGGLLRGGLAGTALRFAWPLIPFLPGAFSAHSLEQQHNQAGNTALSILADPAATDKDSLKAAAAAGKAGNEHYGMYQSVSRDVLNWTVGLGGIFKPAGDGPSLLGGIKSLFTGDAGEATGPSDRSENRETALMQRSYAAWNKAVKSKDLQKVTAAYAGIVNDIAKNGTDIAKDGNDNGNAAVVANQLITLRAQFAKNFDAQKKNLKGMVDLDVELNQRQADLLQVYVSAVSGLSANTLGSHVAAAASMFNNAGPPTGTPASNDAMILSAVRYVAPTAQESATYTAQTKAYKQQQSTYSNFFKTHQKLTVDGKTSYVNTARGKAFDEWVHNRESPQGMDRSKSPGPGWTWDEQAGYWRFPGSQLDPNTGSWSVNLADPVPKKPGAAPVAPTGQYVHRRTTPVQRIRAALREDNRMLQTYTDIANGVDPSNPTGTKMVLGQDYSYVDETGTTVTQKYNADQIAAAKQSQATTFQQIQSNTAAQYTVPAQAAGAHAAQLQNMGNYTGAAAAMRSQVTNLTAYQHTLDAGTAEFYQNLQNIQQLRLQIAQTLSTPEISKLQLTAANSLAPLEAARANQQIAEKEIEDAQKAYRDNVEASRNIIAKAQKRLALIMDSMGPAVMKTKQYKDLMAKILKEEKVLDSLGSAADDPATNQGKRDKAAADATATQTQDAVNAARAQAQMAPIRNSTKQAQAQLNEAIRLEHVARHEKNPAAMYGAQAQEATARIALRDSVEAQAESALKSAGALRAFHGDAVGAARDNLKASQDAYNYAVKEYGKGSQQANDALVNMYAAQQTEIDAELAKQNAALDLDIARLNARGKAGDAEKAAQDQVREAQNALNSYLSKGGKKSGKQYDDLVGALATARRNSFDVALNAQLDTLDFQRETYKITSAQEVAALQQILKNKQLTLAEQRSITLKIKDLQESIRQQLTQGGLNIPSDIKLPTAYQVRRSLGAGFGGSGTTVSTVNNNNQSVVVNNNVPNAQTAASIASQVISYINQQTGAQIRSNSSTPRLVPTR